MTKQFQMKDEMNARLIKLAKERGMTRSGMLNLVVEKGLAYFEKKQFAETAQVSYYPQTQSKPIQPQPTATQPQEPIQQPRIDEEDPLNILASL